VVGNLPQWKACQGYRYKGLIENRAISRSSTSNQFNGWSGSFFLVSVCLGCCRPSHFIWIFWCSLCFCATNINLTSFSWLLTSYYPTFLKVFSFRPKTWPSESDEWLVADDVKAWSFCSLQLLESYWIWFSVLSVLTQLIMDEHLQSVVGRGLSCLASTPNQAAYWFKWFKHRKNRYIEIYWVDDQAS
jgi:hypothetical protein